MESKISRDLEAKIDEITKALDRYESLVEKESFIQKDVAFYVAHLNMYGNSSLELVKALMTLSSGAIGLLIALPILKERTFPDCLEIVLTVITFLAFIFCVCCTVFILKSNSNFLINSIQQSPDTQASAKKLRLAELFAIIAFGVGIAGALSLATYVKIDLKEMTNDRSEEINTVATTSSRIDEKSPSQNSESRSSPSNVCTQSKGR